MFYLYPAYVAWNYYLYIAVLALVTIQAAAAVAGLAGLQLGGRRWPRTIALRTLTGVALAATGLFVYLSPDLLSPGLAGSELMLVFGCGVLTALAVSLLGGSPCRQASPDVGLAADVPEYALPAAGYSYRLWEVPRADGRLIIVLTDPDVPRSAALPLCVKAAAHGFPCFLVEWGREGVPRYPDALAVVPMCISAHGGGPTRAFVIGSGVAADLALRSAADDDRVERVLAVAPALVPENLASGLFLLASMNLPDAWRWYRAWDRRRFIKALRADEALGRVGERGHLLTSADDCLFRSSPEDVTASASGIEWRVPPGVGHRALVEDEAKRWLEEILGSTAGRGDDQPG